MNAALLALALHSLNEQCHARFRTGLDIDDALALIDPSRYLEAHDMLDDMEARRGLDVTIARNYLRSTQG